MSHRANTRQIKPVGQHRSRLGGEPLKHKAHVPDPLVDSADGRLDTGGFVCGWRIAWIYRDASIRKQHGGHLVRVVDPNDYVAVTRQLFGEGGVELDVCRVARG